VALLAAASGAQSVAADDGILDGREVDHALACGSLLVALPISHGHRVGAWIQALWRDRVVRAPLQVLQGMVFSLLHAGHGLPTALCRSTPRLSRVAISVYVHSRASSSNPPLGVDNPEAVRR
jgi:hypothetical protein